MAEDPEPDSLNLFDRSTDNLEDLKLLSDRWSALGAGTMLLGVSLVPLSIDVGTHFTGGHSFAPGPGLLGVVAVALLRLAARTRHAGHSTDAPMPNADTGDPVVDGLARALDARDRTAHRHTRRVQLYAVALAEALGLDDRRFLDRLRAAALLHDIGKLAMPDHILNKPGRLTSNEMETMKLHAPLGADMLEAIGIDPQVVAFVRHHHENWNGAGYPAKLKGQDIPVGARILAVADCFDALTSDRSYRRRLSDAQALDILRARRGSTYEPSIVDAFFKVHRSSIPSRPRSRSFFGGIRLPLFH